MEIHLVHRWSDYIENLKSLTTKKPPISINYNASARYKVGVQKSPASVYVHNEILELEIISTILFLLAAHKIEILMYKGNKIRAKPTWGKLQNSSKWSWETKKDPFSLFTDKMTQYFPKLLLPNLICKLNEIPIKMLAGYFSYSRMFMDCQKDSTY